MSAITKVQANDFLKLRIPTLFVCNNLFFHRFAVESDTEVGSKLFPFMTDSDTIEMLVFVSAIILSWFSLVVQ